MLTNILYTFNQSILFFGILLLSAHSLFLLPRPKTSYKIAQTSLILSFLFEILFYNKNAWPTFFQTSPNIVMSCALTTLMAMFVLRLSSKRSLQDDLNTNLFCVLILAAVGALNMMAHAAHLGILFVAFCGICFIQYGIFHLNKLNEDLYHSGRNYIFISLMLIFLFLATLFIIGAENLAYHDVSDALTLMNNELKNIALTGLILPCFWLLGVAPLHFYKTSTLSKLLLPSVTYFTLVPVVDAWCVTFELYNGIFAFDLQKMSDIFYIFGIISILTGIIGANAEHLISKIFAFIGVFYTGIIFLMISYSAQNVLPICFAGIKLYLLLMSGVMICLYTFKSNGIYLNNIGQISGLGWARPYIGAAMMFFALCFMGLPPFIGFTAQFVMLKSFHTNLTTLYLVLIGFLSLMPVFLKILQALYFKQKENHFDRTDTLFHILAGVIFGLCLMLIWCPQILIFQADF